LVVAAAALVAVAEGATVVAVAELLVVAGVAREVAAVPADEALWSIAITWLPRSPV
jgi:hypothetical protein